MNIQGKTVCLIIAPENFRDEELIETRHELESAGARVALVSSHTNTVKGMLGATARPEGLISDVDPAAYDAVVFIGGSGSAALFEDSASIRLARGAAKQGKLVGAICIAPSILANAGLLKGRRATVFGGDRFIRILRKGGSSYTAEPVTVDGSIITADGPTSATRFGRTLVKALSGR